LPSRVQTLSSHPASRRRMRELRLRLYPARQQCSIMNTPGHPRDQRKHPFRDTTILSPVSARHSEGPPFRRVRHSEGPPFSVISSSNNLRLGIRLGLGLESVVWLWQNEELFHATTMNDGFQNGGPDPYHPVSQKKLLPRLHAAA